MGVADIPTIETDRLRLRAPTMQDAAEWAAVLAADDGFLKYVPTFGRPPQERAEISVRKYLERWDEGPLGMGWSVVVKEQDRFIGFAEVDALSDTDGEIGYFLTREHWGLGYASEVAKAVTDYWFSTTQGERMLAYVVPENVGSVRAVTKIGYTRTRTIDYLDFAGNPPGLKFDTPLVDEYELTRAQWEATQPL